MHHIPAAQRRERHAEECGEHVRATADGWARSEECVGSRWDEGVEVSKTVARVLLWRPGGVPEDVEVHHILPLALTNGLLHHG